MKVNKLRNKRLKDLGFKSNLKLLDRSIINWDEVKLTKEDVKELIKEMTTLPPCSYF